MIPATILNFITKIVPWQVWVFIIMLVAFVLALMYASHLGKLAGEQAVTEIINKANQEATDHANAEQTTVDACYAGGGTWDRDHRLCISASPGK